MSESSDNINKIVCDCGCIIKYYGVFFGKICPKCGKLIECNSELEIQKKIKEVNNLQKEEALNRVKKRFLENKNVNKRTN